jgi:hypothetical protein
MPATDKNPISINLQSPTNFKFALKRAPSLSYWCQTFDVPGISCPPARSPSPSLSVPFIGDHLVFAPLHLTFKVDDDLQNWLEIFNWMNAITNPDGDAITYKILQANPQYTGYGLLSDLQVFQLDSQKQATLVYHFNDAFPVALSGPRFDASNGNDFGYITSSVSFTYVKYNVTRP